MLHENVCGVCWRVRLRQRVLQRVYESMYPVCVMTIVDNSCRNSNTKQWVSYLPLKELVIVKKVPPSLPLWFLDVPTRRSIRERVKSKYSLEVGREKKRFSC